jgi:tryptophanyl-tRNA synthetase
MDPIGGSVVRILRAMTRVFSGIQPTGQKHLGNYIGAIRHWPAYQDLGAAIYCVVDLHSISVPYDVSALRENTLDTAATLMAAGLDPDRCTIFAQSAVPEHSEGAWLLGAVATFGELSRMTQFKDKSEGQESVTAGLFDYPVLMVADIVLYDTDEVPIGDDQRQHLELARDVAIRFNNRFGDTFVVPTATFPPVGARIMDLQNPTAKMSKSTDSPQGTVPLLDPPEAVAKKIKSAVTDSGTEVRYDPANKPGVSNLLEIHASVTGRSIPDVEREFADSGYGAFKSAVADAVVEALRPLQEAYTKLEADPGEVDRQLALGADKARAIAEPVLARARDAVGLLPPPR